MAASSQVHLQRIGGAAALAWGLGALMLQLSLFLIYIPSLGFSVSDLNKPERVVQILAAGRAVFIAETVVVMALAALLMVLVRALYQRLRAGSPEMSFVGAAYGCVAIGFLLLEQARAITEPALLGGSLSPTQLVQLVPVFDTLRESFDTAFMLLLAAWILVASVASLKRRELTRPLAFYGILASAVLVLSAVGVLPSAGNLLGQVWFIWLGLVLILQPAV